MPLLRANPRGPTVANASAPWRLASARARNRVVGEPFDPNRVGNDESHGSTRVARRARHDAEPRGVGGRPPDRYDRGRLRGVGCHAASSEVFIRDQAPAACAVQSQGCKASCVAAAAPAFRVAPPESALPPLLVEQRQINGLGHDAISDVTWMEPVA